jgi:Restriction endonuclease/NACHT domain
MNSSANIRLLGKSNNERGDLFTRLTKDLFFALGYDNLRLNVQKSGRELDLIGQHRFESRRVIAECKAHKEKIGGADLNKFFGVLTRERKRIAPTAIAGYFVSLAGFTEPAIEQEVETDEDRLVLLDGKKVVDELERSRVVVERTDAVERAGQCAARAGLTDAVLDSVELLGDHSGYLWAVYYERGKKRSHFALIHADGTPLREAIAADVIRVDKHCGGSLRSLKYLPPPSLKAEDTLLASKVAGNYRQWLGEECGYIYLDGMPADTELSATRLKLERLFVPLKGTLLPKVQDSAEIEKEPSEPILPIGEILDQASHLAILAAPGGGKSTLLKRLATAYAFTDRRQEISDDLPQRHWTPLFLRCRELRDRAHRPILELLNDISRHAGMNSEESLVFQQFVHASLHAGEALLLIDGLDEISDEGARRVFAGHLRTFLAMFPKAAVVVTSREAGFRLVAGVIASACRQAKLAALDEHDVLGLCERWHMEVLGGSEKVRAEARTLGQSIWANERIRQLTQNPLLLTTLLVVRRWIGELPRSRAALYREAIRVLVRTWNVEGFAPLDEDETLAQLSYVACAMMEEGKQQIGQRALLKLLQSARRELEAELQFARISPQEFVDRIEYRSSLLMQTGYERTDDSLEPVYEFRHLTFQEYLAARGYVEEQYSGRDSGRRLADLLEPHFGDERWQEVIPVAAVLAGRKADDLIQQLVALVEQSTVMREQFDPRSFVHSSELQDHIRLLYQCIRDEVQITTPTLRGALLQLGCYSHVSFRETIGEGILNGKFSSIFKELIEQAYVAGNDEFGKYLLGIEAIAAYEYFKNERSLPSPELLTTLLTAFLVEDPLVKIKAALVVMRLAFNGTFEVDTWDACQPLIRSIFGSLSPMIRVDDLPSAAAASWALAWLGENELFLEPPTPELLMSLYSVWRRLEQVYTARYPAWALATQPLLSRDTFSPDMWGDCDVLLRKALTLDDYRGSEITIASLVVGWYRRAPWTDDELVELLTERIDERRLQRTVLGLLENLGEEGKRVFNRYEQRRRLFQ